MLHRSRRREGRDLVRRWTATASLIVAIPAVIVGYGGVGNASGATAADTLNILAWEGYTEPSWIKPFERANKVKINVSYAGSGDDLFAKIRGGGGTNYDVVATNRSNLGTLSQAKLIVPLDRTRIPNFKNVYPSLQYAGTRVNGKLYGVPYTWGSIPLMYSVKEYPQGVKSWRAIFNPTKETCGKILLPEDSGTVISTAALSLGMKNVYSLTDAQYAKVKTALIAARKCTKAFYTGFGDAANYFAAGSVNVGLSIGSLITKLASERGADVREVVPREGALGWMDTWVITKGGAEKSDLAYKWLNYALSAKVQLGVVKTTTYGPAVRGVSQHLSKAMRQMLHLDDPTYLLRLVPMKSPEKPDSWEKRLALWNQIRAGG